MLTTLYRSLPIYYVLICAILGMSVSWLITSEIEMRFSVNQPTSSQTHQDFFTSQQNQKPTDNSIITNRNIFNSNPAKKEVHSSIQHQKSSIKQPTKKAPSNLTLLGTVVAGDESLAVIGISNVIEVIRIKQNISDSGTLASVKRGYVEISTPTGELMQLQMDDSDTSKTSRAPKNIFSIPKQRSQVVRNIGNNSWVIPANEAENIRTNISSVIKQVRIDPHITNGKTDGFVVKRIRRNTLLNQMGIKRGDIIHAVNGVTLDSPEKGLQIFQQLREAKNLSIDLKRANKSMNFKYEIK